MNILLILNLFLLADSNVISRIVLIYDKNNYKSQSIYLLSAGCKQYFGGSSTLILWKVGEGKELKEITYRDIFDDASKSKKYN